MNAQTLSVDQKTMNQMGLPEAVNDRLSLYYPFLKDWETIGYKTVTCENIGSDVHLEPSRVMEDLESIGIISSPRIGYVLCNVIYELELFFGWNKVNQGIIVGAGSIGSALLGYGKFEQCGLKIVAAFDLDESKIGGCIHGKAVYPLEKLVEFVQLGDIDIGVVAVPATEAQIVADLLVEGGIRAIWNFSPVHLEVPESTIVQNQDLYCSLATLSKKLKASTESVP